MQGYAVPDGAAVGSAEPAQVCLGAAFVPVLLQLSISV